VILNVMKQGEANFEHSPAGANLALAHEDLIGSDNGIPNSSYFSVFDGHGGNKCANFLRENLHQYILNDSHFPDDCHKAINTGILAAEKEFLKKCKSTNFDKSGSCALLA
jgi:serine/threonine protein phosphatase PrpC